MSRLDDIIRSFRPVDDGSLESFTVRTGYIVTIDGRIVDDAGRPYTGDVSTEHQRIAEERRNAARR
jgi:hypothetical protein